MFTSIFKKVFMVICLVLNKLWLDFLHHLHPKKTKKVYYAFIGKGREVNERKILPPLSVVMFGDESG
jgi:hypothetical protein